MRVSMWIQRQQLLRSYSRTPIPILAYIYTYTHAKMRLDLLQAA